LVVSQRPNRGSGSRGVRGRSRGSSLVRLGKSMAESVYPLSPKGAKDEDSHKENSTDSSSTEQQPKGRLLNKIKKFAGKVKRTVGELGGGTGMHKFKEGELARYRVGKVPKERSRNYDSFDHDTWTVEGE